MNEENIFKDLDIFYHRMEKLGIVLKLGGNFPWIYLESVNGHKILEEDYTSNHGFVLGWYPIKSGQRFKFDDLPETFKLIKKYK